MGGINDSNHQKWVVYGIAIPTLFAPTFFMVQWCNTAHLRWETATQHLSEGIVETGARGWLQPKHLPYGKAIKVSKPNGKVMKELGEYASAFLISLMI